VGVHFVNLQSSSAVYNGGAVSASGFSAVTIDISTFVDCFVRSSSTTTYGGGCSLSQVSNATVVNSCGNRCSAKIGQFLYFTSTSTFSYLVNSSTLLSCGSSNTTHSDSGGVSLEDVSATVESLNSTDCTVPGYGCAVNAYEAHGSFVAQFLTVVGCDGQSMLDIDESPQKPSVSDSNFVSNTVRVVSGSIAAILAGGSYSAGKATAMTVNRCIFQKNEPDQRSMAIADGKFAEIFSFQNCVFSDAIPGTDVGSGNGNTKKVTASLALRRNDVSLCFASPCPTISYSARRSATNRRSYSLPITESPHPTKTILGTVSQPFLASRTAEISATLVGSRYIRGTPGFRGTFLAPTAFYLPSLTLLQSSDWTDSDLPNPVVTHFIFSDRFRDTFHFSHSNLCYARTQPFAAHSLSIAGTGVFISSASSRGTFVFDHSALSSIASYLFDVSHLPTRQTTVFISSHRFRATFHFSHSNLFYARTQPFAAHSLSNHETGVFRLSDRRPLSAWCATALLSAARVPSFDGSEIGPAHTTEGGSAVMSDPLSGGTVIALAAVFVLLLLIALIVFLRRYARHTTQYSNHSSGGSAALESEVQSLAAFGDDEFHTYENADEDADGLWAPIE
jgi:hypothetical protein